MIANCRQISPAEVSSLQKQGCRADNWDDITVGKDFNVDKIYNCRFAGHVYIGNNVYISNVAGVLADYVIHDDVYIENVGQLVCGGQSSFGNGIKVVTVNEAGGREVPIYEGITAQIAYIIAMYRHRTATVKQFELLIDKFIQRRSSSQGVIGRGARITGCGTIDCVNIGEGAVLCGVTVLKNGTICSSVSCPARIGYGVMIYDFITAEGANIENGVILKRCYIGQACHIDSGFSGTDTLFFANCDFANGETCSVFAAPYTVSHHKSSLLIAGLFSFFNAGSGTNQSNHLFKTGAVHQAIHERGCKYASNGYVMAPAKTGAFSVILGRHTSHHNTENFPFSYLVDSEDKTYLLPAANLRSYGMVRDIAKWPARDKRGQSKRDLINFEQHNPFLGERIIKAIEVSGSLLAKDGVDVYNYERVRIKSIMLRRGLGLYKMALNVTIGKILSQGYTAKKDGSGTWVDIAGMIAPKSAITRMLDRVDSGELDTISQIETELIEINNSYGDYAYDWAFKQVQANGGDVESVIAKAMVDSETIKDLTTSDALHDAETMMSTGYGIDATDKQEIAADFEAVRKIGK